MDQGPAKPGQSANGRAAALRITAVYLLAGGLWIALSDSVLKLLVPDMDTFARISTYKGWFFVLGTALLIFFLVDRALARAQRAETGSRQAQDESHRLAAALEQAGEAVAIWDPDLQVVYLNQAYQRQHGQAHAELLGRPAALLDTPQGQDIRRRVLEQGQAWSGRVQMTGGDGGQRLCEVTVAPVRGQQGQILNYVQVEHDITQEVEREQRLRHSQKMEAIGTLASGVAHDFNNILAVMMGYAELAGQTLDRGHPVQEDLGRVLKAGERARDLVRQILAFSRQGEQHQAPLDLGELVAEGLNLLRGALPASILLERHIADRPAMVLADPTEMHQVLMNLCANAAQAMPGQEGRLVVSVECPDIGQPPPGLDLPPGPYVLLKISDNGQGMPPQVRGRIFEPFFTTKEVGQGTGLGLSVVHGIVRGSGGDIAVKSSPGQGATFSVYLPRVSQEARPQEGTVVEEPTGQGERVLVVDDERSLAEVTGQMLARLGYRARVTHNALEALALVGQDPGAFDLVLSDQTMPLLTGLELARRLHQMRPDLPVLLTTGFSDQLTPESLREAGVTALLMKPATSAEMARQVRRALGQAPPE